MKLSKWLKKWNIVALKVKTFFFELELKPSNPDEENDMRRKQSAAFCYRINPSLQVLLVRTSGRKWTFPKGTNIKGQQNHETARINALEEAGAHGKIEKKPFSRYKHYKQELKNNGEECINDIFLLKVEKTVDPTEDHREPTWFAIDEAEEALCNEREAEYAAEFSKVIQEAKIIFNRTNIGLKKY